MSSTITESLGAKLLALAFASVLALPLVLAPWEDHDARAKWEKRELTDAAHVAEDWGSASFYEGLERFIDDHVFGALAINRAYRRFQFEVLGDSPVPNVAMGDEGFVFLTSHNADRPLEAIEKFCEGDPGEAKMLLQGLNDLSRRLALRSVSLSVAIVPSKLALYRDRLPRSLAKPVRELCLRNVPDRTVASRVDRAHREFHLYYPLESLLLLRDEPYFYPPGNFHANSRLNHEFARGLIAQVTGGDASSLHGVGRLEEIDGDLLLMGFSRQLKAWQYRYDEYGVTRLRRTPEWLKSVYQRVTGYGHYLSERPISNRKALVLSNSFGAFLAKHLAPGFAALTQVNIRALRRDERDQFLEVALNETEADELIILVHDAGFPNQGLKKLLFD